MNKVYKLTQARNNALFTVYGKSGNAVNYHFKGGNSATNTPATFMTKNKYYQDLLESSALFQKGVVKLSFVEPEPDDEIITGDVTNVKEIVEDVKTVSEAVQYVADKWGVVLKTAKQAKEYAAKHGVDFVNLKVK